MKVRGMENPILFSGVCPLLMLTILLFICHLFLQGKKKKFSLRGGDNWHRRLLAMLEEHFLQGFD